jgi:multidrug efflux pump subunit AcrA (membrane-fusion protein)
MYANVVILMQERTALVVPSGSIRFDETGESSVVYVVKGGTSITHVSVTTGRDDGNYIEIVSGLTGDERIVTGMLGRLQDGQAVKVLSN